MDQKGLSNKDVAKALRLSDGRVVRFWTAKKDARPIPYPSWYTLRHKFRKRPDRPHACPHHPHRGKAKHDAKSQTAAKGSEDAARQPDADA